MVHAIEQHIDPDAQPAKLLGRVSFDILGRLANDTCEIHVTTIRPGRTIELVEATLLIRGQAVVRARVWLLARNDTSSVAGGAERPLPDPVSVAPGSLAIDWPGGFVASLDVRPVGDPAPGRATMWLSTGIPLIDGEVVSNLASFLALVDTANGAAPREDPRLWAYPNVDLTVHLHRAPTGPWVGLDTSVVFGPTGLGITSTVLHDRHGPVGTAQQILTLRPQPKEAHR